MEIEFFSSCHRNANKKRKVLRFLEKKAAATTTILERNQLLFPCDWSHLSILSNTPFAPSPILHSIRLQLQLHLLQFYVMQVERYVHTYLPNFVVIQFALPLALSTPPIELHSCSIFWFGLLSCILLIFPSRSLRTITWMKPMIQFFYCHWIGVGFPSSPLFPSLIEYSILKDFYGSLSYGCSANSDCAIANDWYFLFQFLWLLLLVSVVVQVVFFCSMRFAFFSYGSLLLYCWHF